MPAFYSPSGTSGASTLAEAALPAADEPGRATDEPGRDVPVTGREVLRRGRGTSLTVASTSAQAL